MKKALLLLMCGLLLFEVAALADVHFGNMPDEHGMDLRFGNGNELRFGGVASMFWETGDANANYLAIELPSGSAIDVPVLGIGIGLDGVDLADFNGMTQPLLFLADLDRDSEVYLSYSADDVGLLAGKGSATSFGVTFETLTHTSSIAFYNYTPAYYIGYDADAWCEIAVADTTGNVTITQTGSTMSVAWTAAGGFVFTGAFEVVGAITFDTLTLSGDLIVDDDFIVDVDGDITLAPTGADVFVTGNTTQTGSITATATITAGTFADGTATLTGGDFAGLGTVSATTLTDGTATLTSGDLTGLTALEITGNTTQTGSITLFGATGDITTGDDLTVADDCDIGGLLVVDETITILETTAPGPAAPATGGLLYWDGTNLIAMNAAGQTVSLTAW